MHLILLSGENLRLARLEAESLLKLENTRLEDNYLFCTIPTESMQLVNRLSYARKVYEIVYVTARSNLEASLKEYPWINFYEKSFCVRVTSNEHYDERYYAGFVWDNLEKSIRPKVDLINPDLWIEIFINKETATATRLLYHNFENFENRKAHLRPVLHPTAMHPKMARALVNILACDNIVDPFCGACGILTEAGLLGIHFTGYDIDKKILEDARKNLEYYDIDSRHYKLIVADSTKLKNLKNVVTDLPYGKSSKKSTGLDSLYAKFLKTLNGRSVVVMPSFMPYKKLLDKNLPKTLMVLTIIDHYVHKSLTRKIILIDKKKGSDNKIIKPTIKKKKTHKVEKIIKHKKEKHFPKRIKHYKTLKNKVINHIKKLTKVRSKKVAKIKHKNSKKSSKIMMQKKHK